MYCDIVIGAKWGPPQYKYLLRGCEIINYSQGKKKIKEINLEKKREKRENKKGQKILFMYVYGSKNKKKGKKKKEKIMLKKLFSFLFFVNYKRIIH